MPSEEVGFDPIGDNMSLGSADTGTGASLGFSLTSLKSQDASDAEDLTEEKGQKLEEEVDPENEQLVEQSASKTEHVEKVEKKEEVEEKPTEQQGEGETVDDVLKEKITEAITESVETESSDVETTMLSVSISEAARKSDDVDNFSIAASEFQGQGTITGDFAPAGSRKFEFPPNVQSVASSEEYTASVQIEKIEEEEEKVEEKMDEIDRIQYYDMYDRLDKQYREEKVKNVFLISRLAKYYQKRRMFHVLHEGTIPPDTLQKYEQQLDDFDRITEETNAELVDIRENLEILKSHLWDKEDQADLCFQQLQKEEHEAGKEDTTEKKVGYDVVIDRQLNRQKIQMKNLRKIRLQYIKIRNKVTEVQAALDAIDNLGSHLHLIDFEQLKHDNRNLRDKLEEKDLELNQVRRRCRHAMQILAHRREKALAIETDIVRLSERLEGVTAEYEEVREELNLLKKERDSYRSAIYKMKKESGLMSMPRLLRDMNSTIKQKEYLTQQLEDAREEYAKNVRQLKKIRKKVTSISKMDALKEKMRGDFEESAADIIQAMSENFLEDFSLNEVEPEISQTHSPRKYF